MSTSPLVEIQNTKVRFPGVPEAMDGTAAIVAMETAGSDAAGAYPITPSTQMGEGWSLAVAQGKLNVHGTRGSQAAKAEEAKWTPFIGTRPGRPVLALWCAGLLVAIAQLAALVVALGYVSTRGSPA